MANRKPESITQKEFENFQETILKLLEKQNSNVEGLFELFQRRTDINNYFFREIISLIKSQLPLIFSLAILAIFWDKLVAGWSMIFDSTKHLYIQTSPDAKWHTFIIIPLTVILTFVGQHLYRRFKGKKKKS